MHLGADFYAQASNPPEKRIGVATVVPKSSMAIGF